MPEGFQPATPASAVPIGVSHFAPSHIGTDPVAYLPPAAADRFRNLTQHINDLRNLCPPFEQRQEANTARAEAERAVTRLKERRSRGGFELDDDDPRLVREQAKLDALAAEAKRIEDRNTVRQETWGAASNVLANVTAWLRDGRPAGTALEVFAGRAPSLEKAESVTDAIERLRYRGRELKADLARLAAAPFPSSHAKQRMREQIETLAMRGAPSVSALVEHDGDIAFADERHAVPVIVAKDATIAGWQQPDALALVCWLHKDALIARLDAEISSEADDKSALSHAERQKREAEAMADLLAVERDECWWVWAAIEKSLPVEHRSDVSPLALLGLKLVTTAPVNGGGTSWQHAIDIVGLR